MLVSTEAGVEEAKKSLHRWKQRLESYTRVLLILFVSCIQCVAFIIHALGVVFLTWDRGCAGEEEGAETVRFLRSGSEAGKI